MARAVSLIVPPSPEAFARIIAFRKHLKRRVPYLQPVDLGEYRPFTPAILAALFDEADPQPNGDILFTAADRLAIMYNPSTGYWREGVDMESRSIFDLWSYVCGTNQSDTLVQLGVIIQQDLGGTDRT